MSVNHTHDEISQLIFLRGESFSRHSAASHASIMLEALVSGGLGKLWVTPRSASIYKTCLARVFLHSTGSWSVCALHFVLLLFSGSTREALGRGGVFGPPAAPRHGITTSLCCLVKGFFILINTLIELCGLPSSRHLFRSGEQTLNIERYVSQNQSCVNLELPHLNNWGMDPAECLVYMEYR